MKSWYDRESKFQTRFIERLKRIPKSEWVKVSQRSIRGTPDLIGNIGPWAVYIELKRSEDEKPDALQRYRLLNYARSGALAFVAHPGNWDGIAKFLEALPSADATRPDVDCLKQIEGRGDPADCLHDDAHREIVPLRESS